MRKLLDILQKKDKVGCISKIRKKKYERLKSLRDVLRPIYMLSIIFGLRVFEFPRGHPRPILSFIYATLLYILFNVLQFYYEKQYYETNVIDMNNTITYIAYSLNNIVIFIIVVMGLYQSEGWKLMVKRINEIDETLKTLGSLSSFNEIYKTTRRDLLILLNFLFLNYTLQIIRWIFLEQLILKTFLENIAMIIYTLYSFIVKFILMMDFFTILRCIKSEFQRVNELLSDVNVLPISSIALEYIKHKETYGSLSIEQYLPVDSVKLFTSIPSLPQMQSRLQVANYKINRSKRLLRTLRQVHLQLYKISKDFSKEYGLQISLKIALYNLIEIYVLYSLYITYQENKHNFYELLFPCAIIFLHCLQYALKIFIINYISDKTTKEAERTNEILQTFYGFNTDYEIRKEVEIFSLQMIQCRTTFSTFGFYNLSCKHICSCIGIITTYMVILIQVSGSVRPKSSYQI